MARSMRCSVSILICTFGEDRWQRLAHERAYPSAVAAVEGRDAEIHSRHGSLGFTLAEVRNRAAQEANGDWLCFLDADDELDPDYLQLMAEYAHINGIAGAYPPGRPPPRGCAPWHILVPAVSYHYPEGRVTSAAIPNGGGKRPLIDINHVVIGALIPRALFLELGGFHEWNHYEDWELFLRCEEAGARFIPCPAAIYHAHVSEQSRHHGNRESEKAEYQKIRGEALARRNNLGAKPPREWRT